MPRAALVFRIAAAAVAVAIAATLSTLTRQTEAAHGQGHGDGQPPPTSGVAFALKIAGLAPAPPPAPPATELKVVGAGFFRSGTKTTKRALQILGFTPMHTEDMQSNGLGHDLMLALTCPQYFDLYTQKVLSLGFDATVDTPQNALALDWARKFPNAKVLLGVRDSPEQWAASVKFLLSNFVPFWVRPFSWFVSMEFVDAPMLRTFNVTLTPEFCAGTWWRWFPWYDCVTGIKFSRPHEDIYIEWIARLQRELPPSRLLVFNTKQGWDPLVKFLGVPKPDVPFPHENDAASIAIIGRVFSFVNFAYPFIFFGLAYAFHVGMGLLLSVLSRLVRAVGGKRKGFKTPADAIRDYFSAANQRAYKAMAEAYAPHGHAVDSKGAAIDADTVVSKTKDLVGKFPDAAWAVDRLDVMPRTNTFVMADVTFATGPSSVPGSVRFPTRFFFTLDERGRIVSNEHPGFGDGLKKALVGSSSSSGAAAGASSATSATSASSAS